MIKNEDWALPVADGGYYGVTGLAGDVHPAADGSDLILSLVKEALDNIVENGGVGPTGSIQILFEME